MNDIRNCVYICGIGGNFFIVFLGSLLRYMLPRKRAGEGAVVGESENNNIKDVCVTSEIKKHRICATASTCLTVNNNTVTVGNNSSSHSSSSVVEPSIMTLGYAKHNDIDEDLYSLQLAVCGRETMRRLFASNILISGMQGLGAEIAKNLILAGVKPVTLHDEGIVELWDLSNNFAFSENDVGKNRELASVQKLQELNNAVPISTLTTKLTKEHLSDFQTEVRGHFGSIFCDFGPELTVVDVDGEVPHTGIIASISNDNPALVSCIDDERLEFQDGDFVVFSEVQGMTKLNDRKSQKIRSANPYSFTLEEDTTNFGTYVKGGIVSQVKQPKVLKFNPLREALKDPGDFLLSDFSKFDHLPLLHLAFQALDKFISEFDCLPVAGSEKDTIAANINECLEREFFYFDSVESLPVEPLDPNDFKPLNSRYDAQISVFGSKLQKKLEDAKVFIVGSGALGCEFLKNLALMGVSCGSQGKLTITDDDVIEKSNLSRQFLFHDWNIGQAKSTIAASAAASINSQLKIEALQNCVGPEIESVFNDAFWENLTVAINALDNVDARLYVDQRCLYFQKPLLESGTLGAKCNTQMVIPYLTENYGASRDPPEKQAPMCTVHSFPHNIDHCLTWARSEFEGLLEKTPAEVNACLSNPVEYATSMRNAADAQAKDNLERILKCLDQGKCETFQDCVTWARLRFEDYFVNRIKQLKFTFPEDAATSTGAPFWSAPKRFPHPLQFSAVDPSHLQFIMAASILRAAAFDIPVPDLVKNPKMLAEAVEKVIVPDFQPKEDVKIVTDEKATRSAGSVDNVAVINQLLLKLELCRNNLSSEFRMKPIQFEKEIFCSYYDNWWKNFGLRLDDDTNFHVDLIAGLANMRARNHSIPEVDKLKAKLIAGRIIPSIATATAMATGLVCLKLYKVLDGAHKVEDYRNTFTNLALPLFSMAEPVPHKVLKHRDMKWTVWDRWVLRDNPTLKQVIKWLTGNGLNAYSISYGNCLLFNSLFLRHRQRLDKKVVEVVREFAKAGLPPYRSHLDVSVACDDNEGNDMDIPPISTYYR
ncbi:hypothetical protein GOBAR_DD24257 [Gossypium barbadense]|nr:hypothetical protein GOBAR_DD24257 [Gossypium barbadense]